MITLFNRDVPTFIMYGDEAKKMTQKLMDDYVVCFAHVIIQKKHMLPVGQELQKRVDDTFYRR